MLALALAAVALPHTEAKPGPATPHLAGTMPEVEGAILHAFQAANVSAGVIWIAADTNGHLTVASVGLAYNSGSDPLPVLQARGWALVRTAFAALPTLDEVDLSAVPQSDVTVDLSHSSVMFSVAASRAEVTALPPGIRGTEAMAQMPRLWYHPLLRQPNPSGKTESQPLVLPQAHPTPGGLATLQLRPTLPLSSAAHHQDGSRAIPRSSVIFRGDPSRHAVAVTFDDGPFPIYTTLLLDTLDRLGLKATFFLVGEQVEHYPYFAQAIVRAGHEIGNHTYHHVRLAHLPEAEVEDEITRAQEAIADATGQTPRYFRPPGGRSSPAVLRIASALGLMTIFWTANSGDYANPGPQVLEAKILGRVHGGGILLLHQGVGDTIRVLPQTAEVLRRRGLALTTVSGLLVPRGPSAPRGHL